MSAVSAGYNELRTNAYRQLSSGKRINSAKDDAAGLAISEKLLGQQNGFDQSANNARDAQNLLRTAEGGLNGINDMLLRIRDLSVYASSGILTDEDKGLLQEEVGALLKEIDVRAQTTEFNKIKVLDGFTGFMQTGPNAGSGSSINIESQALDALGIKDYDLTKKFDITKIESAIDQVNTARAKIGAQINRYDHNIASNEVASVNLAESRSRIADTDFGKAVSDKKKGDLLEQFAIFAQRNRADQEKKKLNIFGV